MSSEREAAIAAVEKFRGAQFPASWKLEVEIYDSKVDHRRAFVSTTNRTWMVKDLGGAQEVLEW